MKKFVLVLLILMAVVGSVYARPDLSIFPIFPSPIQRGNVLLSPVIGLGVGVGWGFVGFGMSVTVAADYALPIPLMVGLETGAVFIFSSGAPVGIPIMARVSWHPNWGVKNLDTFVRFKIGYNIGVGGEVFGGKYIGGLALGFSIGARYFFSDLIGVFGELGWNGYWFGYKWDSTHFGTRYTASWPMGTFFSTGVTFKLKGFGGGK